MGCETCVKCSVCSYAIDAACQLSISLEIHIFSVKKGYVHYLQVRRFYHRTTVNDFQIMLGAISSRKRSDALIALPHIFYGN